MRLPYGESNFAALRRGGYVYVDKTGFLPALESGEKGRRFLVFLRPRRMGKTLLLSMLEQYYDVLAAPDFSELFGGLAIERAPTSERGIYAVLRMEMTGMVTSEGKDRLRRDFQARLHQSLEKFWRRYKDRMPEASAAFDASQSTEEPASLMSRFLSAMSESPLPLYILIDEYDNFTNDLIARGDHQSYRDAVHASGFVREFYKTIKEGTATGVVRRIFMTGVSPVTLDDLTSGFNITKNVSLHEDFNALCGFTAEDVKAVLSGVLAGKGAGATGADEPRPDSPSHRQRAFTVDPAVVFEDMRLYYNGYLFSKHAEERMFNSDMVLYFLSELTPPGRYPEQILDLNVRTDYGRIQRLLFTPEGEPRRNVIDQIQTVFVEGSVATELQTSFPLDQAYDEGYFVSLLYYMGLLTLQKNEDGWLLLGIPNYAIRTLYWEAISRLLHDLNHLDIAPFHVAASIATMSRTGDMLPFLELVFTRVIRKLSNRDMIRLNEKTMKVILLAYLSLSEVFFAWSEVELGFGYGDLVLIPNRSRPQAKVGFLIELKYLKAGATEVAVGAKLAEAEAQLERYLADERLKAIAPSGGFRAVSVAFVGMEACTFKALGNPPVALG